jgi:hypothetical protein
MIHRTIILPSFVVICMYVCVYVCIIIITTTITFMQSIYNCINERNHLLGNVFVAILYLQCMLHVTLCPMLSVLYIYGYKHVPQYTCSAQFSVVP